MVKSSIFKLRTTKYIKYITIYIHNLGYITLNSLRQHNHFITQGNYKATCFNYRLVILRPIFLIESQDAMHTLGFQFRLC